MRIRLKFMPVVVALVALVVPLAASGAPPAAQPGDPELLATLPGAAGAGSAVGPGGALYDPAGGRRDRRVDPTSGAQTLYASGLPQRFSQLPFGGVMDVAFIGSTAYALVSVVGATFPADLFACNPGTIGIYRVRAVELNPRRRRRLVFMRQSADGVPIRRPDRSPIRPRGVPGRIPRYGRAPQPRPPGLPRRDDHGAHRVCWVTSSRRVSRCTETRSTSRRPVRYRTSRRTERSSRSSRALRPRRRWRTELSPRRRGARPGTHTVCPLAGRLPLWLQPGLRGAPAAHDTGSLVQANANGGFTTIADEPRSAVLARADRHHGLRGHARRRDLDDRRHLRSAVRLIELRNAEDRRAGGSRPASFCPAP